MAREFQRSDRVADAIQRSLANCIASEIRDPRVGMVNINSVVVTRDLAYAKVYVTFVGSSDDDDNQIAVDVLNNASSFLRIFVAKDVKMRTTPKLQFFYDVSSVRGQELSALIDRAVADDVSKDADDNESER